MQAKYSPNNAYFLKAKSQFSNYLGLPRPAGGSGCFAARYSLGPAAQKRLGLLPAAALLSIPQPGRFAPFRRLRRLPKPKYFSLYPRLQSKRKAGLNIVAQNFPPSFYFISKLHA